MRKSLLFLYIAAFAILVIIAWSVIDFDLWKGASEENANSVVELRSPTVLSADPVVGYERAPVTIIVFSDFACPYCASMTETLGAVITSHPEDIRVVWKDLIVPEHSEARNAAEAARCAKEQGAFWQYHEQLFANQLALTDATYQRIAQELDLDIEQFTICRGEHRYRTDVLVNYELRETFGIESTPHLFINGDPYEGYYTVTELEEILTQYL